MGGFRRTISKAGPAQVQRQMADHPWGMLFGGTRERFRLTIRGRATHYRTETA
jgi:hypothetical protein